MSARVGNPAGRWQIGPACGGEPPYCFVVDGCDPAHPIAVFGRDIVAAEDRARTLAARLNDPGMPVWVEVIEPAQAGAIPVFAVHKGGRR